jgi:hypothetical protein
MPIGVPFFTNARPAYCNDYIWTLSLWVKTGLIRSIAQFSSLAYRCVLNGSFREYQGGWMGLILIRKGTERTDIIVGPNTSHMNEKTYKIISSFC